jgi:hypothetical protein
MRPFVKREGRAYDQRQMAGKVACGNPACVQLHQNVDEARACLRPTQRVEWYGSNLNRVPVKVTFQPHPGDPLGQRGPDVGSPMLVGEAPGQYEAGPRSGGLPTHLLRCLNELDMKRAEEARRKCYRVMGIPPEFLRGK